jgi:hypothetical protein
MDLLAAMMGSLQFRVNASGQSKVADAKQMLESPGERLEFSGSGIAPTWALVKR